MTVPFHSTYILSSPQVYVVCYIGRRKHKEEGYKYYGSNYILWKEIEDLSFTIKDQSKDDTDDSLLTA